MDMVTNIETVHYIWTYIHSYFYKDMVAKYRGNILVTSPLIMYSKFVWSNVKVGQKMSIIISSEYVRTVESVSIWTPWDQPKVS